MKLAAIIAALFSQRHPERGPPSELSVENERLARARGYQVKRPRFTQQDVRHCARSVFPEIGDLFYAEVSEGLEIVGTLTGTGIKPAKVRCKYGEQNRMRTGFIRFLVDGKSRDSLRI